MSLLNSQLIFFNLKSVGFLHISKTRFQSDWIKIATILFLFPFFAYCRNQPKLFDWSAGFRIGIPLSVSVKHYINPKISFEAIGAYNNASAKASWMQLALAGQYNFPFKDTRNFNWFIGMGLSAYRWNWKSGFNGEAYAKTVFGTFAQIGLDYKFKKAPINISIDYMPSYQLSGYDSGLTFVGGAIGLRYVFQ